MMRDFEALIELMQARQARGFRWRFPRDCVSFVAACVKAQTGRDLLAGVPRWRTRAEALAVADAQGGLIAAIDARLRRVEPAMARRGDIAGLPDPLFGVRLMIVEGDTLVGPGQRGLERLPRSEMVMAWSADDPIAGGAGNE